jgi:hypothetical protein
VALKEGDYCTPVQDRNVILEEEYTATTFYTMKCILVIFRCKKKAMCDG